MVAAEIGVRRSAFAAAGLLGAAFAAPAPAADPWPWAEPAVAGVSARAEMEGRGFFHPPRFAGQRRHGASLALEAELYVEWDDYTSLAFKPWLRRDSADRERSHGDIRELWLRVVRDDWELGAGIGKLFWGTVESFHLVDIANQTDLVEDIDLEEKLGQPMASLTLIRDRGWIDLIWMPYFRERTFPGRGGRLRGALPVDSGQTRYESGAGRRHSDFAARYSNSFGDWDAGLYWFRGASREPSFVPVFADGAPALAPFYEIIDQAGLDAQYTVGAQLWKLEALYRRGQRDRRGVERDYAAFAGGLEYTFYGPFGDDGALGGADLGILAEYLRDSRNDAAPTAFQNDAFVGGRLAFNDARDSAVLAGVIQDLTNGTRLFSLEAGRRIGDNLRLTVEARLFSNVAPGDAVADFRDDDFVRATLERYF